MCQSSIAVLFHLKMVYSTVANSGVHLSMAFQYFHLFLLAVVVAVLVVVVFSHLYN
jgi:hypothetical protein